MLKFEWKIKFFPNFFLIKKAGIVFWQCVAVSYNLFIQEHCKLVNLFGIWTLLRPPLSWILHRLECLILGCFFYLFFIFWELIHEIKNFKYLRLKKYFLYSTSRSMSLVILISNVIENLLLTFCHCENLYWFFPHKILL